MKIAIIGAGVIGLSTGIELLNKGYNVTIYARELAGITSDVAAAIWMPFKIEPQEQAIKWALQSLPLFKKINLEAPQAGVQFKPHTNLCTTATEKPAWVEYLEPLPNPDYVLDKYKTHSYTIKTAVIDPIKYMPYLRQLYLAKGGIIQQKEISDIHALVKNHNLVVNCTGLNARTLVNDITLYPIRGHVIRCEKIPGFDASIVREDDELTHIITRTEDCLLGGVVQKDNWNMQPDKNTRDAIIARAHEIYPFAKQFKIIQEMIGLRPGRSPVRLELERIDDAHVIIHNYGHGGAGYTVSWGCAQEVARLTAEFLNNLK